MVLKLTGEIKKWKNFKKAFITFGRLSIISSGIKPFCVERIKKPLKRRVILKIEDKLFFLSSVNTNYIAC